MHAQRSEGGDRPLRLDARYRGALVLVRLVLSAGAARCVSVLGMSGSEHANYLLDLGTLLRDQALDPAMLLAAGWQASQSSADGWTSVRHPWGSTNARQVRGYAFEALVGEAKLRLSEIVPFSWGHPLFGHGNRVLARVVAKIAHLR